MLIGKNAQIESERLKTALEAAGVGVWDYDLVRDELVWSLHCYRLFGITDPFPMSFDIFLSGLHPLDRERTKEVVQHAFNPESGGTYDIEYRTVGIQDGITRWVRATGKAYFDATGKAYRFVGTIADISAQKEAEAQLQESEARFRNMADSAPVMIWITDPNGHCNYLNLRWLEFTGQTMEEGSGIGWADAVHPDDRHKTKEAFVASNTEKRAFRVEYRLRSKSGQYRWMLDSALPRFDEAGRFLGYIGSVLDISDRKQTEEELQFRTAQLEAQNEATEYGLLLVDTKGKILSQNKRFSEMWHMPQEIIDSKDDNRALEHAQTMVQEPEQFIRRVKDRYESNMEVASDEFRFKDGRIIERTGRPVTGKDGMHYGYLWQFRDITAYRAAQDALELRTALLEAQNEASPLGILVIDQNYKFNYFNKGYVKVFDLPQEVVANPSREALLGYFEQTIINYEAFNERITYLYNNPVSGSLDEVYLKNGKIIERYGYPIRGKEGRYFGWTWQFRDITEERRYQEYMEQKNRQLETLIQEFKFVTDFMPQMVWATQPDGYHDFFNKQWYDYTGLDYETTKDKGWSLVLHPDDSERTWQVWHHSLETGAIYQIEYRMRRYDGVYRWMLGRAIPMRDAAGTIIKWFGTCTDIDDQRRSAELLEQKVAERTRDLQEANENLERSNAELEQFAYVASHDLQEPLRKIRTFTTMLEGELQRGDLHKSKSYIERIWQSSSRMQELIRDLLDFSRLNQSEPAAFELVDLNTIAKNIIGDLELSIAQKGAEVHIEPLPHIEAHSVQMSQLFYNLLSNALKFTKAGQVPEVKVSCALADPALLEAQHLKGSGTYYHLRFSDNGIGFLNDYAQQIFTIFQRLHNRSTYEGTGIGLALCKKVVVNHHGAIYAEGEEDKGATFHVLLPEKQGAI
ncbi:PAS domain S-box-containing protein [Cnuella takakiae]|uniref:histidine kinase n=1 Tax=Cnuella takakiae TaxID=1302690 RepID=A0A1M5AUW8_9BACT|nr:PAS domain S-box protein [Cnuella takakiae]OLY93235.1 hypothetical protein BUE76_16085 [Cnuella takakiae]SHF34024.1 PAS domain S-box-containing protein [Cnuella takakiae]